MRIGVDIDGVLADFVTPFLKYHNGKYGSQTRREDLTSFHFSKVFDITPEEAVRRIDNFYTTSDFENLQPMKGAVDGIAKISSGNDLFVITSRKLSLQQQTRRWLERNFPRVFKDVYFARNHSIESPAATKGQYCGELGIDVHIEDGLEYAIQCAADAGGTKVLLFDAPWNECSEKVEFDNRLVRVFSWREILPIITKISYFI